ncbi:hypothetical protein [Variovorax atrisoli]|uniref:hypothetical protein n=1 Tax=Variovorax atrisoli TaxID=3394203 RepID=UPI00339680DA
MTDQTSTLILPRFRGGRLTRHDRRVLTAEATAKTDAWLASPAMVARRQALLAGVAATASTLSRPTRSI